MQEQKELLRAVIEALETIETKVNNGCNDQLLIRSEVIKLGNAIDLKYNIVNSVDQFAETLLSIYNAIYYNNKSYY
jgi:hypothetical protein